MEVICRSRTTDPLNNIKKLLKKHRAELKPPKVKSLQKSSLVADDIPPKPEHKKRKIEVSSECSLRKKPKLDHCQGILTKLMKQKWSVPFLHPVDPDAVGDYFRVVKHPMDFATIKRKLQQNKYLDDDEFAADVRLIFSNVTLYHPSDNWVHLYAMKLSRVFDILWLPVKPKLVKEPILEQNSRDGSTCIVEAAMKSEEYQVTKQREQERADARASLEQMERSITLDDNLGAMRT
ncbi:transcription factor GTE1-like [Silene latifolia]|uniref:transcription factor GTE1-like n=1 Tax=Silene latifolia TaxID=37657 RepID=UPI003D77D84D